MKVARDSVHAVVLQRGLNRRLNFARCAHANRVGHIHALHANLLEQAGQISDTLGRNLAFIRAADGAAHRCAHGNASGQRGFDHWGKALDALGNAAIDIFLAESFTRRAKHHDFIGLVLQRGLEALQIRRQHRIAHAVAPSNALHHRMVVGHLRHPLGRDVAGDFNLLQTGVLQALH